MDPLSGSAGGGRLWEGAPADVWRHRWGVPALYIHERIGSTNDEARRLAEAGAPAGTTVLADFQYAGRGRGDRRWETPPGAALLVSILLRLSGRPDATLSVGTIPLRAGLAVAHAVERAAGVFAGIKWPNDVVLAGPRGGKLAGILCEGAFSPSGGFVIVGIGLNVHQREADFPPEIRHSAVSLRIAAGQRVSRAGVADAIIAGVLALARDVDRPLDPGTLRELAARDVLRGRRVAVDGAVRGTAVGVAPDGALLVRGSDGRERPIRNGTVRALDEATSAPGMIQP